MGVVEAAVEAARVRLRPILMTALSFILGVIPLVLATGAGAASRHSLGTAVFGGMVASTFLSLGVVPVLYVVIVGLTKRGIHASDFKVAYAWIRDNIKWLINWIKEWRRKRKVKLGEVTE
jgi:hypothetical protein